jgi:hypothetical protein
VRFAFLAPTVLALVACSAGKLADAPDAQGPDEKSPGTVMLRLDLPSTRSFCDQLPLCAFSAGHISIATASGQSLQLSAGLCPTICSAQCAPVPCTAACPIGGGQPVTEVALTWDGSYVESGTCGTGTACFRPRFAPPGRYTARMCVTPGTLAPGDGGPATCTATGPQECADVTFDVPGPALVEVPLPAGAL